VASAKCSQNTATRNRRQALIHELIHERVGHTHVRSRPTHRRRPARKSQGRELRADAVKVRRPRARAPNAAAALGWASGVGAKRRTLYGVEHSSTLTNVTAAPVRTWSEGRADLAGDAARKPVVNVDMIHVQNALVIAAQIVGQRGARTRRLSSAPRRSDTDRQAVA